MSGPFKTFMDSTACLWFARAWKDKLAGGFTNSHSLSGDKFNTLVQLVTFASQHQMNWVSLGLANESGYGDLPSGHEKAVNHMGSFLGLMAQSENESPEITPPSGDLKTARLYGERFAQAVIRWNQA